MTQPTPFVVSAGFSAPCNWKLPCQAHTKRSLDLVSILDLAHLLHWQEPVSGCLDAVIQIARLSIPLLQVSRFFPPRSLFQCWRLCACRNACVCPICPLHRHRSVFPSHQLVSSPPPATPTYADIVWVYISLKLWSSLKILTHQI